MAKDLARKLKKELSGLNIELTPTEYAGHAEELAYDLAKQYKNPLIISSSGDGGYHEVVNGVMKAVNEGYQPICAVLPAGNANDHSRTMHDEELWKLISVRKVSTIDLLKVTISAGTEKTITRYAHSYAGVGLSAVIATELNKTDLNPFKEKILVAKKLYSYRPFMIEKNSEVLKLDSLIFANINQMAKVLSLSKENKPDDGKFEVISFPYQKKLQLIKKLIKSTVVGLEPKRYKKYQFKTLKKSVMQLDGEIIDLPENSKIEVVSAERVLRTIV